MIITPQETISLKYTKKKQKPKLSIGEVTTATTTTTSATDDDNTVYCKCDK